MVISFEEIRCFSNYTIAMVVVDPSEKAKTLLSELDKIDKEIREHQEILAKNNIDMTTPLVDAEGFPSDLIDVVSVRKARHNIICLRNDREKLMSEMSEALAHLHQITGSSSKTSEAPEESASHRTSNEPFAKIDSVERNSPAENAKFEAGDLIIQLGTLHAGNFENFEQLKNYVLKSENTTLKVTVFRPDSQTSNHVYRLELRPQKWQGPGIIGCTFSPMKTA